MLFLRITDGICDEIEQVSLPKVSPAINRQKFQGDGLWYTNSATPVLTVAGMTGGDSFAVRREGNGNSTFDSSTADATICQANVPGGQVVSGIALAGPGAVADFVAGFKAATCT